MRPWFVWSVSFGFGRVVFAFGRFAFGVRVVVLAVFVFPLLLRVCGVGFVLEMKSDVIFIML